MELVGCPEPDCHQPAEVVDRFDLDSTSGPVTHVATYCISNHSRIHTV